MWARISSMERISGLEFGDNQDNWNLWLQTVKKALPKMRNSSDQDLDHAVKQNANPWVRLFAIKELCTRPQVDVKAILARAKADESKEVRNFAKEQLVKRAPKVTGDAR